MKNSLLRLLFCFMFLLILTGCQNKKTNEKITLESLINEDGLIFTISANINCIPVELSIYENGKYEFRNNYKIPKDAENTNSMLIYSEPKVIGTSNYDVIKIIENSEKTNKTSIYEIFTGQGESYTTDNNNKYLIEYLNSIRINLNACALEDYN